MEPAPDDRATSQLAERYLPEAQTKTGIYLVGWYPVDLWTDASDYRRARASSHGREQLLDDLNTQASSVQAELSVRTTPFVLDVPRPHNRVTEDADGA